MPKFVLWYILAAVVFLKMYSKKVRDSRAVLALVLICTVISTCSLLMLSGEAEGSDRTMSAIRALPVSYRDSDEDPSKQRERLHEIRTVVNRATPYDWERKLLILVAWHESRFYSKIQRCEMAGDNGRAHNLWQTWNTRCPASLQRFADEAIRHLRSTMRSCGGKTLEDRIRRGISLYATGRTCEWAGAAKRVKTWRRIRLL